MSPGRAERENRELDKRFDYLVSQPDGDEIPPVELVIPEVERPFFRSIAEYGLYLQMRAELEQLIRRVEAGIG